MAGPLALHIFSLLLHVLASIFLLLTIRRLIPGITPLAAGFAAGLFAAHPVHAEAVAWVGTFIHPLVTIFLLAAYLAHNHSRRCGRFETAILAATFFALALLSNEMAVAFPIFILLTDRIRFDRWNLAKNLHYFILLAVYLLIRKQVLGEAVPLMLSDPDLWLRMPVFLLEYLRHLLLPWPQPLYLQMPVNWGVSIAAIITTIFWISIVVWISRRSVEDRRVPLIALIWIAVFLLPPLATAFSPDARFALRSLYLPSVGIAILLAWAIHTLPAFRRPQAVVVMGAIFLLAISGTITANRQWADDGKVYGKIIAWNPSHPVGYLALGRFHERRGETGQALMQYERAASLAGPSEQEGPLAAMALLLGKSGDNVRSLEMFRQLTVLKPDNASAWNGVGNNLWALGQLDAAAQSYMKAHELDPSDRIVCYNLVLVLTQLNRTDETAPYLECAQKPQ